MKHFSITLLFFFTIFSISFAQHSAPLTILHYNDFHAQYLPLRLSRIDSAGKRIPYFVGGAAEFKAYLDARANADTNVLILNAGDNFQGSPASSLTHGSADITMMNLINADVATLGNHEFDYSVDTLRELLPRLDMPEVSANLWDVKRNTWFVPPSIIKVVGGVRIAVIGLAPPDLSTLTIQKNLHGLKVLNPLTSVRTLIKRLRTESRPHLIVVLSHMGVEADSALAVREKDIDVIIGGHSHTAIFVPKRVGHSVICQAGSNGRFLGELKLQVDTTGDSLAGYSGRLIETIDGAYPPDIKVAAAVDSLEKIVGTALSAPIGTLAVNWVREYDHESNIGNWHADAMRKFGKTDIAFLNSGSLRKNLDSGTVTVRDIWEIDPFGNDLATFTVSGKQLRSMLEWQAAEKRELAQVSGLTYIFDSRKPAGKRLISVRVQGKPIVPGKRYSIIVNSYIADHTGALFGIKDGTIHFRRLNVIDRDIFIGEVKKETIVTSGVEGRIIDAGAPRSNDSINEE